jgi:pimeloyl-ACP methyl ester carboxylesterase
MALSTFANGRLWGARYGSGRPWALGLHGWGRDHHDFDVVLGGVDAIAVDLPGFGVAPEPPGEWSTLDYARYVAPVLDELIDGPIVVVGHSFGARVAVHVAAEARDEVVADLGGSSLGGDRARRGEGRARVGAMVLTGAPLAPAPGGEGAGGPVFAYRAGRALHKAGVLSDRRMERLRQKYGSDDYRRATPTMRGVLVKAVAETAGAAYMPVLRDWVLGGGRLELVWGENDQVAPLVGPESGLAGPPGVPVEITVVPGAGHLINAALADQLRAALARHRPPRHDATGMKA